MASTLRSTLWIIMCAGLVQSIEAQAYRVTVLSDGEVGAGRTLAITDAGDAVVRVGDDLGIWQVSPGFGRPAGLTMVGEIDPGAVNRVSRHIDAEARFYGSVKGRASAWSREMGHADLDTRHDAGSWIDDASWPAFLVGGEHGLRDGVTPVLWSDGVRIELPSPPGTRSATATGVNDGGEIVGVASPDASAVIGWPAAASAFDRTTSGVIWIGSEPVLLNQLIVGSGLSIVRADDVDNRGRIAATAVDQQGSFFAVILEPAGADLNGDGTVSPADLNAWISLAATEDRRGDVTGDGVVNAADFAAVIELITTRFDVATPSIDDQARALELSHVMNTNGVYDAIDPLAEPGGFQPGNSQYQNWIDGGRKYHPTYNPSCFGCNGDDANNPHAPNGAPGFPGENQYNPERPNGGPGGNGSDGDSAGDGGNGGGGAPGTTGTPGGTGGNGGSGGNNTDDGTGGRGGNGGSGGAGDDGENGGNGGSGGSGGDGGPNGGTGGDGGPGGAGGAGGPDDTGDTGGAGGNGGTGGSGGDSPTSDGGDGAPGGTGGNGGSSSYGGNGGNGGDGGDGGNGSTEGGSGAPGGGGGTGGNGTPSSRDGTDGNGGTNGGDGTP